MERYLHLIHRRICTCVQNASGMLGDGNRIQEQGEETGPTCVEQVIIYWLYRGREETHDARRFEISAPTKHLGIGWFLNGR